MKIHVFDVDKLPRRVLERTWRNLAAESVKNDFKMASQNDPKSFRHLVGKMNKILIDKKQIFSASMGGPADCVGLLGGKQGG